MQGVPIFYNKPSVIKNYYKNKLMYIRLKNTFILDISPSYPRLFAWRHGLDRQTNGHK